MEREFVMLKPDALQRRLVGEIVQRLENKGLKIIGMKLLWAGEKHAAKHYAEHKKKPFYKELVAHITSGPTIAMVVEGEEAVAVVRKLVGATDPRKAEFGTIRGDYGSYITKNLIHASDSVAAATREIAIYFSEKELLDYKLSGDDWVYR